MSQSTETSAARAIPAAPPVEPAPAPVLAFGPDAIRSNRLAALVWEAIRGSHRDFTQETLGRAILLLAVPMVVEMMFESVFAVVDIFWVAKLGADAWRRWA